MYFLDFLYQAWKLLSNEEGEKAKKIADLLFDQYTNAMK